VSVVVTHRTTLFQHLGKVLVIHVSMTASALAVIQPLSLTDFYQSED
jgi:hypothetical protein